MGKIGYKTKGQELLAVQYGVSVSYGKHLFSSITVCFLPRWQNQQFLSVDSVLASVKVITV